MVKEFYCPSQDKDSWEVAAAEGFESLFRNLFTHNEEETGCRFLANYIWSHLVTFGHGARMEEYLAKERDIYCLLIWKQSSSLHFYHRLNGILHVRKMGWV